MEFFKLKSKILIRLEKSIIQLKFFCYYQKYFLYKINFIAFQYFFNAVTLLSTVFNLRLSFILKIDSKRVLLKVWKKFRKFAKIILQS